MIFSAFSRLFSLLAPRGNSRWPGLLWPLVVACVVTMSPAAAAESEEGDDLLELSLEDLANVSLASSIALGLHHTHPKGQFMLGYTYHAMRMEGIRIGTRDVSVDDVFAEGFAVAPIHMHMRMHMFEFMYGLGENTTAMVMLPVPHWIMHNRTAAGTEFETKSSGIGDVSVSVLHTVFQSYPHRVHGSVGLSLPTGSIDERADTPMAQDQRLPYPMQLGSGSVDPLVGLTYLGALSKWSWGVNTNLVLRTSTNDNGYRLGRKFQMQTWVARRWSDSFSSFLRVDWTDRGPVKGADPELDPTMAPTADPARQQGHVVLLRLGANLYFSQSESRSVRISLEVGAPVYQDLAGPQLKNELFSSIALQWVPGWGRK